MRTQAELRAFTWGCIAGIAIVIGSFVFVCEITGLRFQPVAIESSK